MWFPHLDGGVLQRDEEAELGPAAAVRELLPDILPASRLSARLSTIQQQSISLLSVLLLVPLRQARTASTVRAAVLAASPMQLRARQQ